MEKKKRSNEVPYESTNQREWRPSRPHWNWTALSKNQTAQTEVSLVLPSLSLSLSLSLCELNLNVEKNMEKNERIVINPPALVVGAALSLSSFSLWVLKLEPNKWKRESTVGYISNLIHKRRSLVLVCVYIYIYILRDT